MAGSTSIDNDNFFNGTYKEAWRNLIPQGLTEAEVDFIIGECKLTAGGKVLDIFSGYGRHALELARRGIAVTAIDNQAAYTEEVSQTAASENLPVNAITADVFTQNSSVLFDAIICMGNSFAFFDKEKTKLLVSLLSKQLKPGGYLVVNSWMIAEISLKHFQHQEWYHAGPYKCILENSFKFDPLRIESEQTILSPDGTVEILPAVDYVYSLNELEEIFQENGLGTCARYSTPRKRPFMYGDSRIYIVVEKS